jgi:hypothetical protein
MSKKTCRFAHCHYNAVSPPENAQECIGCGGNTAKKWPSDNPTTGITLHFQDGSALEFALEKPVRQVEIMAFMGELLGKTGNPFKIDLPMPLR